MQKEVIVSSILVVILAVILVCKLQYNRDMENESNSAVSKSLVEERPDSDRIAKSSELSAEETPDSDDRIAEISNPSAEDKNDVKEDTELQWSKPKTNPKVTWDAAKKYCEDLEEEGNSDWRLPDIDELKTLIQNCDKSVSCDMENCTTCMCPECFCDKVVGKYSKFEDNSYFWSSSEYEKENQRAWGVNFNRGAPQAYEKIGKWQVRCVRGGNN